jgi:glycosyltransferase involved in cell wall biosynthesis
MRIHWFSPLTPTPTDIAHFTHRLLPALSRKAEIVLWTDQPHWYASLNRLAAVHRFDPGNLNWAELNRADAAFYNMGNDARFHAAIWKVARRYPGFVIMHDVFMHDSVWFHHHKRNDRSGYLNLMQSLYGASGRRDGEFYWDGALSIEQMGRMYTCAPFILSSALGAIVHSRAAQRTLRREVDVPVARLSLPYPARSEPASHSGPPPWKLIVFGYLGGNRCLDRILTAIHSLENRHLFRLHIYGQIHDPAPVTGQIARLQLESLVSLHGFVPEVELNRALASAHLAINLRFPTKGEASGSQLRIWSHALPSIVARIGWYAELPDDTAAFVRPEAMIEDLRARLEEYAAAPGRFAGFGPKGYQYLLANHSPEQYARAILEMARHVPSYWSRPNARQLAGRMAGVLDGWLPKDQLPGYRDRTAAMAGEMFGV